MLASRTVPFALATARAVLMSLVGLSMLGGCASSRLGLPWVHDPRVADDLAESGGGQVKRVKDSRRTENVRGDGLMEAALTRWRHGDRLGCERDLLKLLRSESDNSEAKVMLADVYTVTNRSDEAVDLLRHVIADEPTNARAHHSLGLLLEARGRTDESLAHLKRAYLLAPDDPSLRLASDTSVAEAARRETTSTSRGATAPRAGNVMTVGSVDVDRAGNPDLAGSARRAVLAEPADGERPAESSKVVQISFSDASPPDAPSYPRTAAADSPVVRYSGPYASSASLDAGGDGRNPESIKRLPRPDDA